MDQTNVLGNLKNKRDIHCYLSEKSKYSKFIWILIYVYSGLVASGVWQLSDLVSTENAVRWRSAYHRKRGSLQRCWSKLAWLGSQECMGVSETQGKAATVPAGGRDWRRYLPRPIVVLGHMLHGVAVLGQHLLRSSIMEEKKRGKKES